MNDFMNALYNAEGSIVTGSKDGVKFLANITNVRVKYGTDLSVTIRYDADSAKDVGYETDLIDGSALFNGSNSVFTNLHVYF